MKKKSNSGFSFGWKGLKVKPTVKAGGYHAMREWQNDAYDQFLATSHMILNAPMGSGKSSLMCWVSEAKMMVNPSLRCLIAVPQTIIASGFAEAKLIRRDSSKLDWVPQHNLCNEQPTEGTINYVIQWLSGSHAFLMDRVLLCTHATLVAVYKRLKETNKRKLLSNLLLWIDEAHHLKNASIEGFDAPISNGIGELVAYLISVPSVQIGLATASFFRGDRFSLLTEAMEQKFVAGRYNLPYDIYLPTTSIRSFSFDFLLCGRDYTQAIEVLAKQEKCKDVIHIPHPQSRDSTGDKYQEVENILSKYKKVHGGKLVKTENGLTLLRGKGEFKAIDLVDENRRAAKKAYIGEIKDKDDLDVIVALGMFKEGANWVWADRSIIVGARSSLVDVIQIIGRLFRDAKGKKHVQVIQLLPFSLDQAKEEEFKENLNNYLKAIYASLILENVLHPPTINIKTEGDEEEIDIHGGSASSAVNWLGQYLSDTEQLSLIEEISNKLLDAACDKNAILWDEYEKLLPETLAKYGVNEHIDEIGRQIWAMFARQTLRMQGIDVDHISFDVLQKASPLEFLLRYTSGSCDINTFHHLRLAIRSKVFITFEEARKRLHEMRANGQPINSKDEYQVWIKHNCDYAAVEEFRRQKDVA